MSSWERSRHIPWSRMPTKTGPSHEFDLENTRERIFRELQKESIIGESNNNNNKGTEQQQQQSLMMDSTIITNNNNNNTENQSNNNNKIIVPYSHMDLLRQGAFGATLGCVTGSLFGFMDSMKSASESNVLQKASNMAKVRYLIQGTTRSGLLFGTFFTCYQCMKYGIRITFEDPGDITEIGIASPITLGALYSQPIYRPAMRYAYMLIGMDCFSLYMRKTS